MTNSGQQPALKPPHPLEDEIISRFGRLSDQDRQRVLDLLKSVRAGAPRAPLLAQVGHLLAKGRQERPPEAWARWQAAAQALLERGHVADLVGVGLALWFWGNVFLWVLGGIVDVVLRVRRLK